MTATLSSHKPVRPAHKLISNRQSGVATLMFAVVLLISLTVITFLSAKTLMTEQAISANEYRGKEVSYAAEAALEYGIAWLDANDPSFDSWNTSDELSTAQNWDDLSADDSTLTAGTDTYTLTVNYLRSCLDPGSATVDDTCTQWLVEVQATATADSDSNLARTQVIRLVEDRISNSPAIDYIRIPGSWRDW